MFSKKITIDTWIKQMRSLKLVRIRSNHSLIKTPVNGIGKIMNSLITSMKDSKISSNKKSKERRNNKKLSPTLFLISTAPNSISLKKISTPSSMFSLEKEQKPVTEKYPSSRKNLLSKSLLPTIKLNWTSTKNSWMNVVKVHLYLSFRHQAY